jgi:hypothetical protein
MADSPSLLLKAGEDQRRELSRFAEGLRSKNTLRDFEQMLENSTWSKTVIDHTEVWLADTDNTFQIERGERSKDFSERWTTVYPDPNSSAHPVFFLRVAGSVVKEITFISMDGGRIFVPMPDIRPLGPGTVDYFWNLQSLELKVCRVIGDYYIYETLEGVACTSRITLVP